MKHFNLILLSVAIAGCTPDKTDTGETTDTSEDTDTDISDPDSGEDTGTEERGVSISGSLLLEDGVPASGVQMRLCYGQCFPAMVDDDGNFNYENMSEGKYSLQAVKLGSDTSSIPSTVLTIGDSDIELGAWVIPDFSTSSELSSETRDVELANGLTVTADPTVMTEGDYTESSDKYVKSAFVAGDTAGIHLEGVSGDLLGIWYLANFDYRMDPGWTISGSPELGLSEGDTVNAYVANFGDKEWTMVGTYQIDANGELVGDANNTGLIALSALALTK